MRTIIVILILSLIIITLILSIRKRIKNGSSCCGTHEAPPEKIKVKDKNKTHYPYKYSLTVDGMYCSNCALRVENTLNSIEGVWATVNLQNKSVIVLSKKSLDENFFSRKVAEAGYTVTAFTLYSSITDSKIF